MLKANSYKTKQFLLVLIKLGLVVAAFYFIYHKLFQNSDFRFDDFLRIFMDFNSISPFTILALLLLSYLNWFFEIIKWQVLVETIAKLSFNQAKAQTLGALTASLITPNRIGEYGAKAMYYQSHLRKKVMVLNLLGNSAQMSITSIIGGVGIIYFILYFQQIFNYSGFFNLLATVTLIICCLIMVFRQKWFEKQRKLFKRLLRFLKTVSKNTVSKVMIFSFFRYLIFSFQFYYLLSLFGVNLGYSHAMMAISTMYLLSSVIPSIFMFDVIIKGGVAVYVFGLMSVPEPIVLSVVTLMWILNFVLPSIIGSYYVLQFKLPKTIS